MGLNGGRDDLGGEAGTRFGGVYTVGGVEVLGVGQFVKSPADVRQPVSYTHLDVYKRQAWDRHHPRRGSAEAVNRAGQGTEDREREKYPVSM